ncbi:MAG: hypothetical protein U0326_08095 [Polyangiales bacterium]
MSTTHPSVRALCLTALSIAAIGFGASVLGACSAGDVSSPSGAFDRDAGVKGPQCRRTDDCTTHNLICVFETGSSLGTCQVPPDRGRCTPSSDAALENPSCYPGARCEPVPTPQSPSGGLCSFQAPQAPLFRLPVTSPKFSATAPGGFTVIRPADGVQLRWTPPAIPADAITVAVVFKNVPQRDGTTNRIANPNDILWIWTSTDPGTSTRPGVVALEAGHRGLSANGEVGPRFGTNQLEAGRYWWFVFALQNGVVLATSDVLPFRVGADFSSVACASVDDCTRMIPGELPDTVACIANRCRRRCASDLDCPGVGSRCDLDAIVPGSGVRRGAFCTASP